MKKFLIRILYVILFILCCWNWLYTAIITSDIPMNVPFNEFIISESSILVILSIFIYLTKKGKPFINIGLLFIPNSIWTIYFVQVVLYKIPIYATIITWTMMLVMFIVLVWNIRIIKNEMKQFDEEVKTTD